MAPPDPLTLRTPGAAVAPGGVTTTVLAASSCNAGAVVPYSDRGPASKCEGSFGEACAYTCSPGFKSFGKHVCCADGAFRGGRCTPTGKVPFLCGGIPEGGASSHGPLSH